MSGSEPAETSDREPAGESVFEDAVPSTDTSGGAAWDGDSTEIVETLGNAEAAEPVDAWASPDGAAQAELVAQAAPVALAEPVTRVRTDAAAPTVVVPIAQPGEAAQPDYGYMQPYQYTPSPEEIQAALESKRKRKRKQWTWTAVVAVVAVVGAGVYVVTSGRHGNSAVSAVTCTPAKLSSCLIQKPSGAVTLSDAPTWDQAAAPSMDAFGKNMTSDAAGLSDQTSILVAAEGESADAHTDWNAVDGDDIDMVLLKFGTIKGAQTWNTTRNGEILAAYTGPAVAIAGDSAEKAHAAAKADAKGNYHAAYSVAVGNMVLAVAYSSPGKFAPADLQNWAGTELTSLWTAPHPPADPADTGAGTEEVACGHLTSCLPATPSGFGPWLAPPSGWVRGSTLSVKQYVKFEWDSSAVSDVMANFSKYDVTGVAHTAWANSDAYEQTDIYLVQTLTESGAEALYADNFGEPNWSGGKKGISYTVPGETDAEAWYANKRDSDGFIDFYVATRVGNTIVEAWCWFYGGSLNKTLANKWAKSMIDKAKATASQQPVGLPSLPAPQVKAVAQGSCAASGDCLVKLPGGAKDTTSSSSVSPDNTVTADEYSGAYDSDSGLSFTTWLGADGFQAAEHRSWKSGGATADDVLLKFGSPAQAQASAMAEYGLGAETDRACTITSISNALCEAAPVGADDYYQNETVTVLAWKGEYEVRVNVTVSNQADIADAYAWAEQQLAMLPAS